MSDLLNPIQRKIAAGMSPIVAFLSQNTCGEACWEAREDICRCSCGGKNHGCMRTADGIRPQRTSRIDGIMYALKAAGYEGLHDQAKALNDAAGIDYHYADSCRNLHELGLPNDIPAKTRTASKDQVARWPELAAYRERLPLTPYLLWVKV